MPAAQASQMRSNFELGLLRMCVPGWQSVHGAQAGAFASVEKVPESQPEQV